MVDVDLEVLVLGTGPAGSASAARLATHGVETVVIDRCRPPADTRRAGCEPTRDDGAARSGAEHMRPTGTSWAGTSSARAPREEVATMLSWGNHPSSKAERLLLPFRMVNDLPRTVMDPTPFRTAGPRGVRARGSAEHVPHVQDADGVTATC